MSLAFPFELRIGRTGFGIIAGCGCGIGFLSPFQLGGVPIVGQLAGTLADGLRRTDSALGRPGLKANVSAHPFDC